MSFNAVQYKDPHQTVENNPLSVYWGFVDNLICALTLRRVCIALSLQTSLTSAASRCICIKHDRTYTMRFINTNTLDFEEIADSELGEDYPENKYAILSHRWGAAADEVSYADINESRNFQVKPGYAKLKGFCDLAASLGYQYGWDDTCSINKGDLNELSEAINSMYRWYQVSDLCIVYLEDVGPGKRKMMDSAWFDRGWTLQELIGPRKAAFYDCNWTFLGMKNDLLEVLSSKTGIPLEVLSHAASPSSCSVAQRMSWAAKRTTTRIEDRAYSLLGIFDVNMPQIYGEREKAFRRLQQAIVQQGKDESIFAWSMVSGQDTAGLYAPSLESFAECSEIISTRGSTGFSENNGEISISLKTFPHSMESYYALLNCTYKSSPDSRIAIIISRTSTETDDEYARVDGGYTGGLLPVTYSDPAGFTARPVHIPTDPSEKPLGHAYGFWLRTLKPPGHEDCEIRILSRGSSRFESDRVYIDAKQWGSAGVVFIEQILDAGSRDDAEDRKGWSKVRWIKMGFDEDFNPMLLLANNNGPVVAVPTHFRRDAELFEQAFVWGPTSQPHKSIFDNRWIYTQGNVPTKSYGWPNGVTVLKVDKRKGMSGTLEALNINIEVKLVSNLSPYDNSPKAFHADPPQIWAVDITDTHGSDPERARKDAQSAESCDSCMACCCSNDYGASASEEQSQRQREARQRKVMTAADLTRSR